MRLAALLDEGTAVGPARHRHLGVLAVRGRIDGVEGRSRSAPTAPGWAARWATRAAGTSSTPSTSAVRERVPVIGLWHSGGARLAEGVEALDGVGSVFAAIVRASGRVPQISVVLGAAAGGAAYGPALTDIVIMAPDGRVFVTGPDVVKSVTGEQVDMEALGGPSAHGRKSGVVHIVADSEADALLRARKVASLFSRPGHRRVRGHDRRSRAGARSCPSSAAGAYNVQPADRRHPRRADGGAAGEVGAEHRRSASAGSAAGRSAWSPTTRCASAAAWTRPRPRRRPGSSGCATRSASRCWWSSTCPATCRASARSGTAWSGAARSCCTRSPRRSCRG